MVGGFFAAAVAARVSNPAVRGTRAPPWGSCAAAVHTLHVSLSPVPSTAVRPHPPPPPGTTSIWQTLRAHARVRGPFIHSSKGRAARESRLIRMRASIRPTFHPSFRQKGQGLGPPCSSPADHHPPTPPATPPQHPSVWRPPTTVAQQQQPLRELPLTPSRKNPPAGRGQQRPSALGGPVSTRALRVFLGGTEPRTTRRE